MTVTFECERDPAGVWTPSDRTLSGRLLPFLPERIETFFYARHRELRNKQRWEELAKLVFRIQVPGNGVSQLALGTECADLFARELETTRKFVISARLGLGNSLAKAREAIASGRRLTEEELYNCIYWAEQVPSFVESFLDILAKYLYVVLFERCSEVTRNTGHRRRSYFREFVTTFVSNNNTRSPQQSEGVVRNQLLFDLFNRHWHWSLEARRLRDVFQHAGRLSIFGWIPDGRSPEVAFASGWIQPPLHPNSYVSAESIEQIAEGYLAFATDLGSTLIDLYKELG